MKRTIKKILCAAAAVLAVVSCQKSTEPVQTAEEGKGTIDVRVNGLMGEYNQVDATKAELVNTVRVPWKGGETVYVYDGSNCIGSLVASLEGTEDRYAVLSTDGDEHKIETPAQGTKILTLVYSPLLTEKQEASHELFISLEAQSGEKAPFVAYATLEYKGETTITGTVVPFKFATSVIKVNCTGLKANTAITSARLSYVNTACKLTLSGSAAPIVSGDVNGTITRTGDAYFAADKVNGEGEAVFQIAAPELSEVPEARVLTVAQGSTFFKDKKFSKRKIGPATSVNTVCQLKALPAGALPGKFSVSATKKILFSKGNLWADGSNFLHFEDAQWKSTPASDGSKDANHVSHFTWSDNVASAVGKSNSGSYLFCDESHKQSINGSEAVYYALSTAEWQYLFSYDGSGSGGQNYDNDTRRGKYKYGVTVCGKTNCVALLPDDWVWNASTVGTNWQTGGYPEASTEGSPVTWQKMHDAGAVCLPAAGFRTEANAVFNVGYSGIYWSSSAKNEGVVYYVTFSSSNVHPDIYGSGLDGGYSVRLITDVK